MAALPTQNVVLCDIACSIAEQNIGLCLNETCEKLRIMKIACGHWKRHELYGFCPIGATSIFTYPEDLSMMTLVCLQSNTTLSLLLFVTPKVLFGALIFLSLIPLYRNPLVSKAFPCCGILLLTY